MGWYSRLTQAKPSWGAPVYYDVSVTTAAIKAGTATVVAAKVGRKFHPKFAAMVATGAVTTSTHLRLVESTSGGIVLGHVAADLGDGVWAGPSGGTVVTTKLDTDCTISEGLKLIDVVANSLTVTTAVRVVVFGYWV